ncbi:MAG TPA: sigma-70 family RNA polymerase sigma factor [Thermodesulfobacteriota bacterium]|nr:sigma-70 family RNA polymerase sigma factor [Thermodesulfobacteriota bacterium]
MKHSDEVLVEETRKGNKKSFELLIIKYEKQIFNLIYRFTKDPETVAELAQETFLKAYRAIHDFKGRSSFYTWLRQIAVNNSINYLNSRRETLSLDADNVESQIQEYHTGENPEKTILSQEEIRLVRVALDSLPDHFRSILVMREFEDMSYEEIAQILHCPVGTVRSRLFHARRVLKEKLELEIQD